MVSIFPKRNHPFKDKRMVFLKRNVLDTRLPDNTFDAIVVVSTIEHIGLKSYGQTVKDADGGLKAMNELKRILKHQGIIILTTPYIVGGPLRVNPFRTHDTNLAEMILEVIERELTGVYHLAGATRISRYDFAKQIAEAFNLNYELVRPGTKDKMNWVASRPRDSSLNVGKAIRELRNEPLEIKEAIKKLKEELTS